MSLKEAALRIQYSNKKSNFSNINLILDHENWHHKLKIALFDSTKSKGLTRYEKIH